MSEAAEVSLEADRAPEPAHPVVQALYVARYEIREMLLSIRSILLVAVYGACAGGAGAVIYLIDDKLGGKLAEASRKMTELGAIERQALIDQAHEAGVSTVLLERILSGDLPPFVFAVLYASTFVIPTLVLLVGFNRISEDVSTRFVRYVFQRVGRGPYLAGKIVGHWVACVLAIMLVHVALLAYGSTTEVFAVEKTIEAMPRIWLAMGILVLGYVGFCSLASSLFRPFPAFALGIMVLIGFWFSTLIVNLVNGGKQQPYWIWMGNWDDRLWALDPAAVAVYLVNTAVFISLAWVVLRRRDM